MGVEYPSKLPPSFLIPDKVGAVAIVNTALLESLAIGILVSTTLTKTVVDTWLKEGFQFTYPWVAGTADPILNQEVPLSVEADT